MGQKLSSCNDMFCRFKIRRIQCRMRRKTPDSKTASFQTQNLFTISAIYVKLIKTRSRLICSFAEAHVFQDSEFTVRYMNFSNHSLEKRL